MKTLKYITISVLMLAVLLTTGCEEDFLDINTDPNAPADATSDFLLPSAQAQYTFAFAGVISRITSTLTKQIVNTRYHRWDIGRTDIGNSWRFDLFGGALKDLETIIEKETAAENWEYVAVAKLQKAYVYSVMTDLWGDLPFSEFGQEMFPAYQDDAEVYGLVLDLIDEAIVDFGREGGNEITPEGDDFIYGGSVENWIKMGNSLKLKMYNQTRRVNEAESRTQINQLIAQNNLISNLSENFEFDYNDSQAPENRHPNYVADYARASRENYMSSNFNIFLRSLNDPRLPYYLENQTANFFGLTNGAIFTAGDDDNTRSVWGVFPVGGRFTGDEVENPGRVDGASGTGDVPFRMITSYMVQFIIAEAELVLNNDQSASATAFRLAMEGAFDEVNALPGIPEIDSTIVENYINRPVGIFESDSVNNEDQLNLIITQKYISQFGNGMESFTDFRRTGYPSALIIDQILNPLGEGVFPRRLPYDVDEFQGPNPPDENILLQTPVFWDVN